MKPQCGDAAVEEQLVRQGHTCHESGSTHPKRAGIDENGCIHVEQDKGFRLFKVGYRTITSRRWNPDMFSVRNAD